MDSIRILVEQYLRAAWRRRWIGVIVAWLICGLGWVGVYLPSRLVLICLTSSNSAGRNLASLPLKRLLRRCCMAVVSSCREMLG